MAAASARSCRLPLSRRRLCATGRAPGAARGERCRRLRAPRAVSRATTRVALVNGGMRDRPQGVDGSARLSPPAASAKFRPCRTPPLSSPPTSPTCVPAADRGEQSFASGWPRSTRSSGTRETSNGFGWPACEPACGCSTPGRIQPPCRQRPRRVPKNWRRSTGRSSRRLLRSVGRTRPDKEKRTRWRSLQRVRVYIPCPAPSLAAAERVCKGGRSGHGANVAERLRPRSRR
jgi:hypothetical protein